MSTLDRRRLGARLLAYGSDPVIELHNAFSRASGSRPTLDEGDRMMVRVRLAETADALTKQVRAELAGQDERPPKRRKNLAGKITGRDMPL